MRLTKEECLKAYNELHLYEYELFGQQEIINSNVFLSLINEHFNNLPLKFEELKEGMWVWNNQSKKYIKVEKLAVINKVNYIMSNGIMTNFYIKFEEHKLYAREVKE